ncbi:uncharacterized protein TM35_001641030, partial [Trypanosoma theileri]
MRSLPHRFTLLLCVLLHIVALSDVAEAAVTFTPTNVVQLSLYQMAQLRFTSNLLVGEPPIRVGDSFYFIIDAGNSTNCSEGGGGGATNNFTVASADADGYTGLASITVRSTVFTVGSKYVICYVSDKGAVLVRRDGSSGNDTLQVWPAIYSTLQLQPGSVAGGQGPVNLTMQESSQEGRPVNQGFLGGLQAPFLIPCGGNAVVNCTAPDSLAEVCASLIFSGIPLGNLRGIGTPNVTGSFTAPYVPNADGYAVCVPVCYSSSGGCGATANISYTVVVTAENPVAGFVVKLDEANPSVYTVTPTAPQAHEHGYMLLTGTNLSERDEIRVIREDSRCTSGAASLLPNLELGDVTVVNATTVNVTFLAKELISSPQRGRVCY